jgi:hypothetical protein
MDRRRTMSEAVEIEVNLADEVYVVRDEFPKPSLEVRKPSDERPFDVPRDRVVARVRLPLTVR